MRIVRWDRFVGGRRFASAAIFLSALWVVGCQQEVPYADPADPNAPAEASPTGDEAPPFTAAEPAADSVVAEPTTSGPPAAATPEETPPSKLPWEADAKAPAPDAAGDLFAEVDEPAADSTTAAPAPEQKSEPSQDEKAPDDFADFLEDAYGMDDEGATEQAEPEAAADNPTTPAEPAANSADAPETTPAGDDWWQSKTAAPETTPAESDEPETAMTPPPKAPTADASSDADLLDELWGDAPAEAPPSDTPPSEPDTPPVDSPRPSDEPAAPRDSLPFDDPLPLDDAPAEPAPTLEEPEDTPADAPALPSAELPAPEAAASAPLAADAIKPLPAVPVLSFNTRHMAWLLGGKLGLAELADLDGATPAEVAEWRTEVGRLAESLKIESPQANGSPAAKVDQRVGAMLDAAARAGAELKRVHGADHAALMEIALKTNALLVVAKDRPDLAGAVGQAVEDAADRAMLPKFLWEDTVRTLKSDPSADQTHDAVVRLHEKVESFLR